MASEATRELCPACGRAPQTDEISGFCGPCAEQHHVDTYLLRDAQEIRDRQRAWRERTRKRVQHTGHSGSAAATKERQRRHRLLENMRPREPSRSVDPLVLGRDALSGLKLIRAALANQSWTKLLPVADEVEEAIRRLAWGPDE